jgi:hypothetical protein
MAREQAECLLQQRYQVAIMQYQVLSDCGRYFWQTPKAWEAVDPQRVTQVGAGAAGAEHPHDPRLFGVRRGRSERNVAYTQ